MANLLPNPVLDVLAARALPGAVSSRHAMRCDTLPLRRPLSLLVALCLAGLSHQALAQVRGPAADQAHADTASMQEVRVFGRSTKPAEETASVGGLSDAPIATTPLSISVLRASSMRDAGAGGLSNAIRGETSLGDFYNTLGYIESLQIRGFLLNNAQNFRRDGLAVSNHAPIALENKESIEVLKGIAGLQSGEAAPGGLVNYVLKRPTATPLRQLFVGLSERGTTLLHGDVGGRYGEQGVLGYRVNVAAEERRPEVKQAQGDRRFASGFFDLRLPAQSRLEAEFEYNHSRQFSVPGWGLLDSNGDGVGDTVPAPTNGRVNLNNQPWSQPFVSRALATSLRFEQTLDHGWYWGARYGEQKIRTDDRIAFPDGCSSSATYVYPGFCGNYDVDLYDYRSDNEIRRTRSGELYLKGRSELAGMRHQWSVALQASRYTERYQPMQAYNWVGTINALAPTVIDGNGTPGDLNTQVSVQSRQLVLTDVIRLNPQWSVWGGLRHTELQRQSVRTDGSRSVGYQQSFTTPWLAVGYQPNPGLMVYLSAGDGVETEVVPNRPSKYVNYGEVLPALRSHQIELGFKQQLAQAGLLTAALFNIEKPTAADVEQTDGRLLRVADGRVARHRGLELAWLGKPLPGLSLQARLTWLDASYIRAADPALVGKRPTNVPPLTASLLAGWSVPGVSGLTWNNRLSYYDSRKASVDNATSLPSLWLADTALVWQHKLAGQHLTLRAGVDNLFDKRAWKDAAVQYWGGVYLFPTTPRTFRVSAQLSF